MEWHFRELRENEVIDFLNIRNHVYPAFAGSLQDIEKSAERYKQFFTKETVTPIGAFSEDDKLLGIMILYDFVMNFRGKEVKTGGIGGVGVDLVNKKQHICRDMIEYGLRSLINKDIYSSVLHPFRVDFYKKMGFGLLSPFYKYRLPTERIEKNELSKQVTFLNELDIQDIAQCYNEHFQQTNGEIKRNKDWPKEMLKNHTNIVVGYREKKKLTAYAICSPVKLSENNFLRHDLKVNELISLTLNSRKAIMGFLKNQADQFDSIRFFTQDETFYQQFNNPADVTKELFPHANHSMAYASTGLMFRVLDTKGFFTQIEPKSSKEVSGINCSFDICEPFLKNQKQSINLKITQGGFFISEEKEELSIKLSMADFSSLIFGAVTLKKLAEYGLADYTNWEKLVEASELLSKCEKPSYHAEF